MCIQLRYASCDRVELHNHIAVTRVENNDTDQAILASSKSFEV